MAGVARDTVVGLRHLSALALKDLHEPSLVEDQEAGNTIATVVALRHRHDLADVGQHGAAVARHGVAAVVDELVDHRPRALLLGESCTPALTPRPVEVRPGVRVSQAQSASGPLRSPDFGPPHLSNGDWPREEFVNNP